MSELVDKLRPEFQDPEYRHAYAEECLNTIIATQIKVLREQRRMTQSSLADKAGMLQPRLSVMEDANYSRWSVSTLKRLAKAFDLALSVKFEAFSEVILDFEEMSRESLGRPSFKEDPIFRSEKVNSSRRFYKRRVSDSERSTAEGTQAILPFKGELVEFPHRRTDSTALGIAPGETQRSLSPEQEGVFGYAVGVGTNG